MIERGERLNLIGPNSVILSLETSGLTVAVLTILCYNRDCKQGLSL